MLGPPHEGAAGPCLSRLVARQRFTLPRGAARLRRVRSGASAAGARRSLDWANARSEQCAAPPVEPPAYRRFARGRAAGRARFQTRLVAGLVGAGRDADGTGGAGDSPAV